MRPFGRKQNSDLETRLQQERPEPSAEFLASVESRVTGAPRRPATRFRYGLAAGFAASIAIVFAAFGGLGTFSTPTVSSRITLAVPASAVPALKTLQAQGGILAASPVQATKADLKAGKVKGIVLAPISARHHDGRRQGEVKDAGAQARTLRQVRPHEPRSAGSRRKWPHCPLRRHASSTSLAASFPCAITFGGGIYY